MNLFGKIAVWSMVILLIPAAIILSVMSLDLRSKWQAELKSRHDKIAENAKRLEESKLALTTIEGELERTRSIWGDVFDAPGSQMIGPDPEGRPRYQFGAGKVNTGFGASITNPTGFAFFDAQPGESSRYIGEFEIGVSDENRSGGRILRLPFENEVESWPQGGNFHLRELVPGSLTTAVAELEAAIIIENSKLQGLIGTQEIVNGQIASSNKSLEQRFSELNGDADAPAGASQAVLDGLVETLRKYEMERNQVLDAVQELRRELVRDYLDLQATLKSNQDLISGTDSKSNSPKLARTPLN